MTSYHTADNLISRVMQTRAESFADRYSQVGELAETLSQDARADLVRKVDMLYDSNPYAALGFTLYGKLTELERRVEEQLSRDNEILRGLAVQTAGDLELKGLYNGLETLYNDDKNLQNNVIISMFRLNPERTLCKLRGFIRMAKPEDIQFVCSNIISHLLMKKDKKAIEELRELLQDTKNGELLFLFSYQAAYSSL